MSGSVSSDADLCWGVEGGFAVECWGDVGGCGGVFFGQGLGFFRFPSLPFPSLFQSCPQNCVSIVDMLADLVICACV